MALFGGCCLHFEKINIRCKIRHTIISWKIFFFLRFYFVSQFLHSKRIKQSIDFKSKCVKEENTPSVKHLLNENDFVLQNNPEHKELQVKHFSQPRPRLAHKQATTKQK